MHISLTPSLLVHFHLPVGLLLRQAGHHDILACFDYAVVSSKSAENDVPWTHLSNHNNHNSNYIYFHVMKESKDLGEYEDNEAIQAIIIVNTSEDYTSPCVMETEVPVIVITSSDGKKISKFLSKHRKSIEAKISPVSMKVHGVHPSEKCERSSVLDTTNVGIGFGTSIPKLNYCNSAVAQEPRGFQEVAPSLYSR